MDSILMHFFLGGKIMRSKLMRSNGFFCRFEGFPFLMVHDVWVGVI